MAKICRLCLHDENDYHDGSQGELHTIVLELLSFEIQSHDKSTAICYKCNNIVSEFYTFYKRAKQAQKEFAENSNVLQTTDEIKEENTVSKGVKIKIVKKSKKNTRRCKSLKKDLTAIKKTKRTICKASTSSVLNIEKVVIETENSEKNDVLPAVDDTNTCKTEAADDIDEQILIKLEPDVIIDDKISVLTPKKIKKSAPRIRKSRKKVPSNPSKDSIIDTFINTFDVESIKKKKSTIEFPSEIIKDGVFRVNRYQLNAIMKKFYDFRCEICNEDNFPAIHDLFQHYMGSHKIKGYVSCCDKKLLNRRIIIDHMIIHLQPSAFECPICQKVMTRRYSLQLHITTHNFEVKSAFKCDQCEKTYSTARGLRDHKVYHLPESQRASYECKICSKSYVFKSSLSHHIATHNENKYICAYCNKLFLAKEKLEEHIETMHDTAEKKKTKCLECGVMCQNIEKHKLLHSEKKFQCFKCDYSTFTSFSLNKHIRTKHACVMPYVCNECGKKFKQRNNLIAHLPRHNTEHKYKCTFCPKRFAVIWNYTAHRKRVHAKELSEMEKTPV